MKRHAILQGVVRDEPLSQSWRCPVKISRVSLITLSWAAAALLLGCTPKSEDVQPAAKATVEPQAVPVTNGQPEVKTARVAEPARTAPRPKPKPAAPKAIKWVKDWPSAKKAAAASGKLIMVDFYTSWCGWCKRLDRDTFPHKTVIEASQDFIPLKLNAEKEGRSLARKHGVRGYPTILFFDHTGKVVGRIGGYLKPAPFAATMKRIQVKQKTS